MDQMSILQADLEAGRRPGLQMVKVINRNAFPIIDRFDGVPYKFMPHKPLVIPPDAAAHFFAWPGERDARVAHMTKRYAWNRATEDMAYLHPVPGSNDDRTLADKYVDAVLIETQQFDIVERSPDTDPDDVEPPQSSYDFPAPLAETAEDAGTHAGKRKPSPPKRLNM